MQFPTTSGGRTAGYRIGSNQSAGIPASPDGSAPSHVVTGAAVEPDPTTVLAGDDAEAVVLNLVQPCVAGARLRSLGGQAWLPDLSGAPARAGAWPQHRLQAERELSSQMARNIRLPASTLEDRGHA